MKDVIYLLFQLLTTLAKLLRPGGGRAVIAENLILKQQLIIHSRSRQRAPNLSTQDRALLGFWSLFLNPRRIARSAIILKPSTLFRFHNALKKRKYRPRKRQPLERRFISLRVNSSQESLGNGRDGSIYPQDHWLRRACW